MRGFGGLQLLVLVVLAVAVFAVQVVALVDAARRPANAFTSERKLTKPLWLVILAVAALIGFLGLPPAMYTSGGFLNLIAAVPAVIYWADVRPRLQRYGPRRGGSSGSGRPGSWDW